MTIKEQLNILKNQNPFVDIDRPCTIGDGILKLNADQQLYYAHIFHEQNKQYLKYFFIPASGAASRMFGNLTSHQSEDFLAFYNQLEKFPFIDEIQAHALSKGIELDHSDKSKKVIFELIKDHYAKIPKGYLPFEKRENKGISAFEKHIEDAILLFENNDTIHIHYTIPENFEEQLITYFNDLEVYFKQQLNKNIHLKYSKQNQKTETISLLENGDLLQNIKNQPITRPAGHGALLENLNAIDADLLFIQNIDNTSNTKNQKTVLKWKQILGGILLDISSEIHHILKEISGNPQITKTLLLEQYDALFEKIELKEYFLHIPEPNFAKTLYQILNKPIRVCGMVKNEGQPGGGPFWIKDEQHHISRQIVESSQINLENYKYREIFQKSTHFNPVNLVLNLKDYKGQKFDLNAYIDPRQYIISWKVYEGKKIKILEYPGLWNGSMADWVTVFVEIPSETFKPVKTVFDLIGD